MSFLAIDIITNKQIKTGIRPWQEGVAYNITFIVTEDCNLRCKYCYQVHKNNSKRMSFEMAKKAVDYFLENRELFNTDAVIWDFIGGEPLLEIELIDKICDYIKVKTYEMDHKWFEQYRFSFSSNGILYHDEKFRKFLAKNHYKCSVGITIDGTKTKHDMQRIYPNGKGSYDDVIKNIPLWLKDFPNASTKVTIGREDLPYLKESIIHLWDLGIKSIPANVVFEDVWQEGDELVYEQQLKSLADYIIENRLFGKVDCTLFDELIGYPNDEETLNQNHCGAGKMIAVDSEGNFYPCLRYADYSLTNQEPFIIGNVNNGIDFDKIRPFYGLTAASQSESECLDCEVARGCAWCQGNNYDFSDSGTNYQRARFICKMHKSRVRANNYFWKRLERECGIKREKLFDRKRHLSLILADDSIEHCNYNSKTDCGIFMSEEIIKKALKFCEENFYTPIILHSRSNKEIPDFDLLSQNEIIDVVPLGHNVSSQKKPIYVVTRQTISELKDCENIVLNMEQNEVSHIATTVEKVLLFANRVNLNIKNYSKTFDFQSYQFELEKIVGFLINYYKENLIKEVNVITDRLFLSKMDNCEYGNYNFALGPNGKIYICPAFYFNNPESYIGSLDEGINLKNPELFKLNASPYCSHCDIYNCDRCVYVNKYFTKEYNIPSASQCKKSYIERSAALLFFNRLKQENISLQNISKIEPISYQDPLELILINANYNPYSRTIC